ncbi:MAG: argininosuccinate lyase [Abditibacteriota bacterium]|nr:argininosuccinate lyase [Abditibacteriota bacterium]
MQKFSTSLPYDSRLWRYDIKGSIAHVQMLARVKVLSDEDAQQIVAGLDQIASEIESGALNFEGAPDEDIHSFVERNLATRIGSVAGKLHTARSRNDQIALDVRLFLKEALSAVHDAVLEVQKVIITRADEHFDAILPGYTHLQRAQPVLLAHHLMAYFQMFERDRERLQEAYRRADVLPLGAAALAGTTFPIDRHFVAEQLGFARVSENSMDTVADRDHMLESTFALSLIGLHLSRLAEEWVLWSAPEWGFITLDDRFSTGSSIMPQKKNPDSMELIRGKSARVLGDLNTLLVLVKALPLTYNRDLQEDKEPLFDAFDTVLGCLEIARGVLETTKFHTQTMRASAGGGFSTATDVADYLVRLGVPFREAHEIVGRVVKYCEENNKELEDLALFEWQSQDERIDESVLETVGVDSSVAARQSYGGTAPDRVREQINRAKLLMREA